MAWEGRRPWRCPSAPVGPQHPQRFPGRSREVPGQTNKKLLGPQQPTQRQAPTPLPSGAGAAKWHRRLRLTQPPAPILAAFPAYCSDRPCPSKATKDCPPPNKTAPTQKLSTKYSMTISPLRPGSFSHRGPLSERGNSLGTPPFPSRNNRDSLRPPNSRLL